MAVESRAGAGYRPYCDEHGARCWDEPLSLMHARAVAQGHANQHGHAVRIEPWASYALVELVTPEAFAPGGATRSDRR